MTDGGNVKIMTVMGDALMDGLSDAGSIPARSILWRKDRGFDILCLFYKYKRKKMISQNGHISLI